MVGAVVEYTQHPARLAEEHQIETYVETNGAEARATLNAVVTYSENLMAHILYGKKDGLV